MSIVYRPATADVLLLYPGESLRAQTDVWAAQHPERQVEASFERSLPEIRKLLRNAGASLVDATEDPSQATDAFLQAVARLGAGAVAMYSEASDDGLELFVRVRGSLFILGPLFDEYWDEVFDCLSRRTRAMPALRAAASRRATLVQSPERRGVYRERFTPRFRRSFDGWAADPDSTLTDDDAEGAKNDERDSHAQD